MDNPVKCEDCKYWKMIYEHYGECHRNPPVIYSHSVCSGLWPKTHFKDWCGEFENAYNY